MEVLISSSIVIMLITTIIPISALLLKERTVLNERQMFAAYLHDELQAVLFEKGNALPKYYQEEVTHTIVNLSFVQDEHLIKGCIQWENAKKKEEQYCLYGKREG